MSSLRSSSFWKARRPAAGALGLLLLPAARGEMTPPPVAAEPTLYIREYRVRGSKLLPPVEVETAVYPYLGPGRTKADVEQAATALGKAYHDKGFQTVQVEIPEQQGRGGVVVLDVKEVPVGRLRVHGSRWFSPDAIRRAVPSLSEGSVPNFNAVSRELLSLSKLPDRRVTPALRTGAEPDTVDVDLNVDETLPLHGSVELNNRYSADTTPLRLSGSLSYGNLWQLGHAIGFSFQLAPLRLDDEQIYSAYYLMRFSGVDWLSVVLQGTKQDSNITSSNAGSINVASPGQTVGLRANIALPPGKDFYQSLSLGWDYKHYEENQLIGTTRESSPLSYYPASLSYSGTWAGKGYTTELNLALVYGYRGLGTRDGKRSKQLADDQPADANPDDKGSGFERRRFKAGANFFYLNGDLSHEHDLPGGAQFFARVHGQLADQPLVNTEQVAGGGLDSVRGYLEAEALGDNGIFGTLELRSPSLLTGKGNEWRGYLFGDAGYLTIYDPLREQDSRFSLASIGLGTRLNVREHLHGSLDAGVPLLDQSRTLAGDWRVTFRVWADF